MSYSICLSNKGPKQIIIGYAFFITSMHKRPIEDCWRLLEAIRDCLSIEYFIKYYTILQLDIKFIFDIMKKEIIFF